MDATFRFEHLQHRACTELSPFDGLIDADESGIVEGGHCLTMSGESALCHLTVRSVCMEPRVLQRIPRYGND
jgi:hypothetical protein